MKKALNLTEKKKMKKMNNIEIDKKKYVLLPKEEYNALVRKAALKTNSEKILSIEAARAYSKKLITKWAAEQ